MAYSEALADRIAGMLSQESDVTTRKMFGGYAFMWRGNMLCGVMGDDIMVRVGPDAYEELLEEPGASVMDFTHRPMKGMVMVSGEVLDDATLSSWVGRAKDFVGALPAK